MRKLLYIPKILYFLFLVTILLLISIPIFYIYGEIPTRGHKSWMVKFGNWIFDLTEKIKL